MTRVRAALALLLCGGAALAHAAWDTRFWGDPILETFRKQQTGNGSVVYAAAAQPGQGPLWFGTDHGLLAFDGRTWRYHPAAFAVTALAFAPEGNRLAFGSWCDLGWAELSADGTPRIHSLREQLPFAATELQAVRACRVTPQGIYYVADDRVLRWDGTKFEVWRYPTGLRLFTLEFEGALWFHHVESGLYRLAENGPERMVTAGVPRDNGLFWLERRDGQLLGVSNRGCWTIEPTPRCISSAELNDFTIQHRVTGVADLGGGFRSVGTLTGGVAIVDSNFQVVRRIPGTGDLSGTLYGQFVGRDRDLWLLGEDRLLRCDATGATAQIRLDSDPRPKFTRFISRAPDQSLWVGAENRLYHLQRSEKGQLQVVEVADVPLMQLHSALAEEHRVWLGGFGGVVLREDGRTTQRFDGAGRHAFALSRLGNSDRWIAALNGSWMDITRAASGAWRADLRPSLPFFQTAAQDGAGVLWTAASAEAPRKWTVSPDGFAPAPLPPPFAAEDAAPSLVVERARDVIVIAGNKVYLVRGDTPPLLLRQLAGPVTACALSSDQKRLYLAIHHGIAAPAGYQDGISVLEFADDGRAAGLRPLVFPQLHAAGAINRLVATTVAGADTLWVGGSDALLQARPAELPEWSPPATPLISAVGPDAAHTTLGYTETLQLRIASPEITLRPALRYQTQFGQDEGAWTAPSERTSFEFSNLREGRYSFSVRAVNPVGQVSAPAYFAFTILPPWYRSNWAYAGYAAIAGLSLLGALRYRERRMRQRTQELERLVRERTTELEKANAAKDEFLASMSHEIRNPMNGVVGLSAAIDISFLDEEGRYRFGLLRHCASHLASLLEDILDFSKLQAGTIELDPQPFSPAELLDAVSAITLPLSAAAGVRVEFALGPTVPPRLLGDARRIRQVLLNYVSNAVKYAPRGTIEVTAWARPLDPGSVALTCAVSDEGPGIPAAEQARIFEKFERGAGARSSRIPGTGMGLAVCRRLAEKMGGRAWVESAPGQGSTFYLELPLPVAAAAPAPAPAQAALDALPRRALVVDDEEYNVVSLAAMLERRGFSVQRALDASTALRVAAGHPPDIIFLDYDMPDTTGPQLARRIRETLAPLGRHPLVLATTAYTTVEKRAECLAAGMDGFLGKPVVEERLQAALEEAIRHRNPASAQHVALPDTKHLDPLQSLLRLAQQHARALDAELAAFAADAEAEFGTLTAALASSQAETAARAAHKIAGRFGFLHAAVPMRRGLQLEQLCRTREWSAARPLAEELAQDWATLRESLARLTCASAE